MARRKAVPDGEASAMQPVQRETLYKLLVQRVETNPQDSAFVVRVARAVAMFDVVREVSRLNKFAARKAG